MQASISMIVGRQPILEAISSNQVVFDKIFVQKGIRGEFEKAVRRFCRESGIPLITVPKEKLNQMSRTNHQGIVGLISPISFFDVEDIISTIFEKGKVPLILVLERISDTRNFGAIARSAEVLGADALVISSKGSARIGDDAVKSSAGALLKIPVCREQSLGSALRKLKSSGLQVFAADGRCAVDIGKIDLKVPVAIILGSEGRGINPELKREASGCFHIPQMGAIESLNVAVAAGIVLYEICRQRMRHEMI